jgi:hypothetical protein
MIAFAALALLAWATLTDEKLRLVTLAILAMFAVKTVLFRKHVESQTEADSHADTLRERGASAGDRASGA